MAEDETPETGDRPLPPGSKPILLDRQEAATPAPQGDQQVPNTVSLVANYDRPAPTAGEYRAAGYVVPDAVPDYEVPGLVHADQWAPPDTVHLVDQPVVLGAPQTPDETEGPADNEPVSPETQAISDEAFQAGKAAAEAGQPRSANPTDGRSAQGKAWAKGWDSVPKE